MTADLRDLDDAAFLQRFETQSIANDKWNHECHVRTAFLYLRMLPFPLALEAIRAGIKALNRANGITDSATRGYHETLTVAWATIIAAIMKHHGSAPTFREFAGENPHVLAKTLLRTHYSQTRMFSPEARATFVDPDLAPLPDHSSGC
ncbi:MAG TPA: hypothetical protein VMT89_14160 [Candidatus Acidoferrales bacterium]|nr:hypothetical protein [Candidatus Acidoferrales bacterium]